MKVTLENFDTIPWRAALYEQCANFWPHFSYDQIRRTLVNWIVDTEFVEKWSLIKEASLQYEGGFLFREFDTPDRGVIPVMLEEIGFDYEPVAYEQIKRHLVPVADGRPERVIPYDPNVGFADHLRIRRRVLSKFLKAHNDQRITFNFHRKGILGMVPSEIWHNVFLRNSYHFIEKLNPEAKGTMYPSMMTGGWLADLIGPNTLPLTIVGYWTPTPFTKAKDFMVSVSVDHRPVALAQFVVSDGEVYWTNTIADRVPEYEELSLGNFIIGLGLQYATDFGLTFNMGLDLPYKELWKTDIKTVAGFARPAKEV